MGLCYSGVLAPHQFPPPNFRRIWTLLRGFCNRKGESPERLNRPKGGRESHTSPACTARKRSLIFVYAHDTIDQKAHRLWGRTWYVHGPSPCGNILVTRDNGHSCTKAGPQALDGPEGRNRPQNVLHSETGEPASVSTRVTAWSDLYDSLSKSKASADMHFEPFPMLIRIGKVAAKPIFSGGPCYS